MPSRLVVLVSGSGTLLQALLDAGRDRRYPARVVAVVADRPGVEALSRAQRHRVPAEVIRPTDFADRGSWDRALADRVTGHRPDLVVLAGFMKLLGPEFVRRFAGRVINSHPSLLPAFPGAHAVRDALRAGVAVTGASVIWVDDGIDTGAVIAQAEVAVDIGDDESRLHERIKVVERRILVDVVADIVATHGDATVGDRA